MPGQLTTRHLARLNAANQERFHTETGLLLPAVRAALGMFLAAVHRRVDQSAFGLNAPPPGALVAAGPIAAPTDNPHRFTVADAVQLHAVFDHATPEWAAAMNSTLIPGMKAMLARVPLAADTPQVIKAASAWRSEWLTQRTQQLAGVPDTVTAEIRAELDRLATENGTSVFDAKNAITDLLSPDRLDWEAMRIARTEVVAANNNGMLASWRSLIGTMGAGVTAKKTWVGGQRPTHSAVSGATIGLDEKFRVGDSEMDGPGDTAGGPGETINCACSLAIEIDDAPTPGGSDGSDQTATMTAAADPDDEWALTAAGDTPNTGACLMAYLTVEDAARLAVPGGEPPENLHVTLAYLDRPAAEFTPEEQGEIDAAFAAAWVGPVTADAFGTALFNPDSEERDPCAVLLVQSDDLSNARDAMLAALDTVPIGSPVGLDHTFPIWIPHTAIAYNAADASIIAPGSTGPLVYDRLVMAWGDDKHDLTATPAAEPEPGPVQALTAATQEQPMTAPTDTPAPAVDPAAPAETGPTWSGPLALIGVKSSDGRKLGPTGTIRPLPLPLNWQHKSAQGHDGSSVVGRILTAEIRDGMIFGSGDWLPGWNEDVDKARQQVDSGLGLVSVDTAPGVVSFEDTEGNPIDPSTYTGDMDNIVVLFDEWELGGATIVNFPAFADARIATDPGTETDDDIAEGPLIMPGQIETFAGENPAAPTVSDDGTTVTLSDGSTVGVGDTVTIPAQDGGDTTDTGVITAIDPVGLSVTVTITPDGDADADDQAGPVTVTVPIADLTPTGPPIDGTPAAAAPTFSADSDVDVLLASSAAHPYPAAAFAKRELLGPTPLTLNRETGEVYGHFAQWGECHIGKLAQDGVCTTPPTSAAGYDYFHLGEVITDAGPLPVGKITVGGGHAGPRVGFRGAVEHYDRTCAQVAVVRAYDDAYGGQFTGMLIPGVEQEKVEEMMRAGQLSGDWRMMKGNLELVAALAVNVPGFPVKRPQTKYGMVGDRQVSLVAAGMVIPEQNTDVVLPSGQTLPRNDWDALVAAAFTAIQQHTATARTPEPVKALPAVDQLALRRATARLALLNTEAV